MSHVLYALLTSLLSQSEAAPAPRPLSYRIHLHRHVYFVYFEKSLLTLCGLISCRPTVRLAGAQFSPTPTPHNRGLLFPTSRDLEDIFCAAQSLCLEKTEVSSASDVTGPCTALLTAGKEAGYK